MAPHFKHTPSKLHIMEVADYASLELKPTISCVQPLRADNEAVELQVVHEATCFVPGQADENIDADDIEFLKSCEPESSYGEDTADSSTWTTRPKPAENPKAAYLAQFSEDNDRYKAAKPNSVVSSPQAAPETAETDSTAKWLKVSAEIQEQKGFACGLAENQAGSSNETEEDKQSKDEASAIDCEDGCLHAVPDVDPKLAGALTVLDEFESSSEGLEKAEESVSLPSPRSGCSISTNSSLSGGSVAEKVVEEVDTVPSTSKEAVFSAVEQTSSGYPEIFAACDHINMLVGEEVAA